MFEIETWELASYVVTVIGLPFAIAIFVYERRRERAQEEEEIYQRLSDEYTNFMKLVLQNADLGLLRREAPEFLGTLSAEQIERRHALFTILIALFERAYLLVHEDEMSPQTRRLWASWEDYMREWCERSDFRNDLPELLRGEDEAFAAHIRRVASEYPEGSGPPPYGGAPVLPDGRRARRGRALPDAGTTIAPSEPEAP